MYLFITVGKVIPICPTTTRTCAPCLTLRPGWELDDPDFTVEREVAAYTLLEQHGIAAPRLIAADIDGTRCGAPALLMTRLDGQRPGATAAELPSFVR